MKKLHLVLLLLYLSLFVHATDSTKVFHLHDSIKPFIIRSEVIVRGNPGNGAFVAGIKTDLVKLYFENRKNEKQIVFKFQGDAGIVTTGLNVSTEKGGISFDYNWEPNERYELSIVLAIDSPKNFSLYSAFVFLAKENNWKFIGTCKIKGHRSTIIDPATFYKSSKKTGVDVDFDNVWVLPWSNIWKNLKGEKKRPVSVNFLNHIDSAGQMAIDIGIIENAIKNGAIRKMEKTPEFLYYEIIKQGTGRKVTMNDTITVFYHLRSINDTTTIEQDTATFRVKKLVQSNRIGMVLCNVGSKIRIVSPSGLSYGIGPYFPDIPPNTILIFDTEVINAKGPD